MFTVAERDTVREWLRTHAEADARVVSAAWVGGSAGGEQDRWSDLDLALGVDGGVADDWTRAIVADLDAVHLSDVG